MNRNIDDLLRPVEESARIKIKDDLVKLQATASSDSFLQAFNLLKDKWCNTNDQNIKDFFSYFCNQWLHKYTTGWYESYAEGSPSSNNALESINNTVKDEGTLRERLSLRDFLVCIEKIVTDWSKDRDPQHKTAKIFNLVPKISLNDWTKAYQYQLKGNRTIKFNFNGVEYYCVGSSLIETNVSKQLCKYLVEKNYIARFR